MGRQELHASVEARASRSAPSRVSYFMQHVVFATVMADASMLDSVIGLDVGGDRQGGVGAAQGPGG